MQQSVRKMLLQDDEYIDDLQEVILKAEKAKVQLSNVEKIDELFGKTPIEDAIEALESALKEQDEEIIEMVKSMPVNNKLLGILSACQIEGCIIHAIDKFGNILEHYHSVEEMPEELRDGYQVYLEHKDCSSIEVYTNNICVVCSNGMVKFVERP